MRLTYEEALQRQQKFSQEVLTKSLYWLKGYIYELSTLHRNPDKELTRPREDFYIYVGVNDEFPDDHTLPYEFEELPVEYRRIRKRAHQCHES